MMSNPRAPDTAEHTCAASAGNGGRDSGDASRPMPSTDGSRVEEVHLVCSRELTKLDVEMIFAVIDLLRAAKK